MDSHSQRWREGHDSYRLAGEAWRAYELRCEVAEVARPEAAAFVRAHHYEGSVSTMRRTHGLFHAGQLVGVALYGVPLRSCVLTSVFPGDPSQSVELSRFVLLDEVPYDGESWTIARSREMLEREGFRGIVAFSDPLPRATADGHVVKPGHIGQIYKASSAVYLGQARKGWIHLLPDGRVFHRRAQTKIRAGEKGWDGAAAALVRAGARPPRCLARGAWDADELRPWLARWLSRLARRVRHPGNHKYAIPFTRADRRALAARRVAYPRSDA